MRSFYIWHCQGSGMECISPSELAASWSSLKIFSSAPWLMIPVNTSQFQNEPPRNGTNNVRFAKYSLKMLAWPHYWSIPKKKIWNIIFLKKIYLEDQMYPSEWTSKGRQQQDKTSVQRCSHCSKTELNSNFYKNHADLGLFCQSSIWLNTEKAEFAQAACCSL